MGARTNAAPVIIKRKKVIAKGGHHGGAWKVAYADFVTAMMAFFMLMWLLNATTEKQRKGLADYFSPTVPINRVSGGGEGAFGGHSMFSEEELPREGAGATDRNPDIARESRGETGFETVGTDSDSDPLRQIEEELMGRGGESMVTDEMRKHIVTRVTDEGLIIELYANPGALLFEVGTDDPTQMMRDLVAMVANVAAKVTNGVAVAAHVPSNPVVMRKNPVWELSGARAARTRRLLEVAGMEQARIHRVTSHADRSPVIENTMAVRNDRIELTLLRNGTELNHN